MVAIRFAVVVSALFCVLLPAPSRSATLAVHLAPCAQGRAKLPADCGIAQVYEDRGKRSGRIIDLHVVVIHAAHRSGRAIAVVPGGPGQGAISLAGLVADGKLGRALSALRASYDLVFVDNRGMGDSHPFKCDITPVSNPQAYFLRLWPDDLVSRCRARVSKNSDPSLYNTNNAVDDLDDVRRALHYQKLVLSGGSYGTFFSFVYIRRHAAAVESAVLLSVDAPHFEALPGAPDGAQSALDDLFAKCGRDAVCRSHFPNFAAHFAAVLHRFDRGPVEVPVKDRRTNRVSPARLSKEVFVDRFRQAIYDPENAAYAPYYIEQAYRGNYAPLSDMIDGMSQALAQALDEGAFLSYSCADLIPFVSEQRLSAAAAHSFAGDLRARAQQRACRIWNVKAMPAKFNDIVRTDIPVLMIEGSDDPATPPRYAQEELPYLRNGMLVIVRGAGHTTETPCTDRLTVQFVEAGSVKGLDGTHCNGGYVVPRFQTKG